MRKPIVGTTRSIVPGAEFLHLLDGEPRRVIVLDVDLTVETPDGPIDGIIVYSVSPSDDGQKLIPVGTEFEKPWTEYDVELAEAAEVELGAATFTDDMTVFVDGSRRDRGKSYEVTVVASHAEQGSLPLLGRPAGTDGAIVEHDGNKYWVACRHFLTAPFKIRPSKSEAARHIANLAVAFGVGDEVADILTG